MPNSRSDQGFLNKLGDGDDHESILRSLGYLLDEIRKNLDRDTFLNDCLDTVVDVLGADRGLILLGSDESGFHVINARGKGRALSSQEREEISKTVIQEVQHTGKCVYWNPEVKNPLTASMSMLGIFHALATPLLPRVAPEAPHDSERSLFGILYIDIRDVQKQIHPLHVDFFKATANIVSMAVEQNQRLQSVKEDLREARVRRNADTGSSPSLEALLRANSMEPLRREIETCLQSDCSILILGESGTGKTVLAQAIAEASARRPIVRAMLGMSDDLNTMTSELFGHERGAYTNALTKRVGTVEFANNGTLILDEILNLPIMAQQLLLDFTQFGTYRPLGYDKREPKRAQTRIIAVTNGDLEKAVAEGRFRQDLYYRLAAATLFVPPLRDRRDDIPALAENVLKRADPVRDWRLSVPLRRLLLSTDLSWPGNVRQLEAVIRRARERALTRDANARILMPDHIQPRDLGVPEFSVPSASPSRENVDIILAAFQIEADELNDSWNRLQSEKTQLEKCEREIIEHALQKYAGVVAHAAKELGMRRTSLLSRMKTLDVVRPVRPAPLDNKE